MGGANARNYCKNTSSAICEASRDISALYRRKRVTFKLEVNGEVLTNALIFPNRFTKWSNVWLNSNGPGPSLGATETRTRSESSLLITIRFDSCRHVRT